MRPSSRAIAMKCDETGQQKRVNDRPFDQHPALSNRKSSSRSARPLRPRPDFFPINNPIANRTSASGIVRPTRDASRGRKQVKLSAHAAINAHLSIDLADAEAGQQCDCREKGWQPPG